MMYEDIIQLSAIHPNFTLMYVVVRNFIYICPIRYKYNRKDEDF